MDENFLLHKKRALRLLERMREDGKAWALYVFSSANALRQYSDDQLVGLGISWVWLGLEGEASAYAKLNGTDTRALVRRLQGLGIRVLGSSIIGLAEHGADNIDRAIDHAVAHDTEFHQFMLYTPVPGTPLYAEHRANGTLLSQEECPDADTHGQLRFNFRHPRIKNGEETEYLLRAFRRDFEVNGPSVTRIARTLLRGWLALKDHPDPRVRERIALRDEGPRHAYAGALWASEKWFARSNAALAARLRATRPGSSGPSAGRPASPPGSSARWFSRTLWLEQRRQRNGRTYEPPTFYEANAAAVGRPEVARAGPWPCRWVEAARSAPPRPKRRLIGRGRARYSRRPSQRDSRPVSFFAAAAWRDGQVLLVVHEAPEDLALRPGREAVRPGRPSGRRRLRSGEPVVAILEAQRHPLGPARLLVRAGEDERPVRGLGRVEDDGVSARERPRVLWAPSRGRRSSAASSDALAKRRAGSFSRQRRTTRSSQAGTPGRSERGSGGVSVLCASATAIGVWPVKGSRPVSTSNSTTPSE